MALVIDGIVPRCLPNSTESELLEMANTRRTLIWALYLVMGLPWWYRQAGPKTRPSIARQSHARINQCPNHTEDMVMISIITLSSHSISGGWSLFSFLISLAPFPLFCLNFHFFHFLLYSFYFHLFDFGNHGNYANPKLFCLYFCHQYSSSDFRCNFSISQQHTWY